MPSTTPLAGDANRTAWPLHCWDSLLPRTALAWMLPPLTPPRHVLLSYAATLPQSRLLRIGFMGGGLGGHGSSFGEVAAPGMAWLVSEGVPLQGVEWWPYEHEHSGHVSNRPVQSIEWWPYEHEQAAILAANARQTRHYHLLCNATTTRRNCPSCVVQPQMCSAAPRRRMHMCNDCPEHSLSRMSPPHFQEHTHRLPGRPFFAALLLHPPSAS